MHHCPRCGRQHKPHARFCDQCGLALEGVPAAETPQGPLPPPGQTQPQVPAVPASTPGPVREGGRNAPLRTPTLRETPGVPVERIGQRYSPTLKLSGAAEGAAASHEHETMKAPAAGAGTATPQVEGPGTTPAPDVTLAGATFDQAAHRAGAPLQHAQGTDPDATLDGAQLQQRPGADPDATLDGARLRQGPGGPHRPPAEAVGWLVLDADGAGPPRGMWPVHRGANLLGSDAEAVAGGIRVEHSDVAPVHLLLWHHLGRTWLIDLESATGTRVGRHPMPPLAGRELQDRDAVQLGSLTLRFRALPNPRER